MPERAIFHAEIAQLDAPEQLAWLHPSDRPDIKLRAAFWAPKTKDARALILLFNGRTEYIEKYGRIIQRLRQQGFAVATLDWRGQGLSTRSLTPYGHVDHFDEYQRDIDALLSWLPIAQCALPKLLLAHSMGGLIGLQALAEERLNVEASIFSAPFWGLDLGPMAALAKLTIKTVNLLGLGKLPVRSERFREPYLSYAEFDGNTLTNDPEYFDWLKQQLHANPAFGVAAPTIAWVGAALNQQARLAQLLGTEQALSLRNAPPSLCLLGTNEAIVAPKAIKNRCANWPQTQLGMLHDARHEILMVDPDSDQGRDIWQRVEDFIERHLATS